MATFSRRTFLSMAAASAAGAMLSRPARGAFTAFGTYNPDGGWGPFGSPRKVLEIFMRGGASGWGAFWRNDVLGASGTGTGDTALDPAQWATITGGAVPPSNLLWQNKGVGQAATPLYTYSGKGPLIRKLSDHMRVIRMGHDLKPHELAIPYAITGTTLGRVDMFGLGALIAWHAARNNPLHLPMPVGIRSIILRTRAEGYDIQAANYAATSGRLGDQYRPPIIPMGDPDFFDALLRSGQTETDALKGFYQDRYRGLLSVNGASTRSAGFSAYDSSLTTLRTRSQELHTLLDGRGFFTPISQPDYQATNYTRVAINGALDLLVSGQLDHAAVIDGGVENDYDTHNAPVTRLFPSTATSTRAVQNGNIWNICSALRGRIDDILDQGITVLINSEFGRIQEEGAATGTEHHYGGYVNVVISDLISTPAFVGSINAQDSSDASFMCGVAPGGTLHTALSPTDVYAALAQVAGIDPWGPNLYDGSLSCLGKGTDAALLLLGI